MTSILLFYVSVITSTNANLSNHEILIIMELQNRLLYYQKWSTSGTYIYDMYSVVEMMQFLTVILLFTQLH